MILHRGTCGDAAKADGEWHLLRAALGGTLVEGACDGACWAAPAATVQREGHQHRFARLGDEVPEALLRCLAGDCADEYAGRGESGLLERLGRLDGSLEDAVGRGAYAAFAQASALGAARTVDAIRASSYPARYGLPRADRAVEVAALPDNPSAFIDRHLLEGDPHRVVEGILVACRAGGVDTARVYLDGQGETARASLSEALAQGRRHGVLGGSTLGGDAVGVEVRDGAPPKGATGIEAVAALSTVFDQPPPPTRLVALTGAIARPGVYEVPVGGATTWTGLLAMAGALPGLVPGVRVGAEGAIVAQEQFEELVTPSSLRDGSVVVLDRDAEV